MGNTHKHNTEEPVSSHIPKAFEVTEYLANNPPKTYTPLRYVEKEWTGFTPVRTTKNVLSELKIVTYNIWFGTRTETKAQMEPRMVPLLDIVSEEKPNIVCLQEVTPTILEVIMEQDWVRKNYWVVTCAAVHGYTGYGLAILSNLEPVEVFGQPFPTRLGRSLLVSKFHLNGLLVAVATNHLESYPRDKQFRDQQLQIARNILTEDQNDAVFLMGDFNFATADELDEQVDKLDFSDFWKLKHPDLPGYTVDPEENEMLKATLQAKGQTNGRHRIDLIMFKNLSGKANWDCDSIKMLGTKKIERDGPITFPSDHFGLSTLVLCNKD